MREEGGTIVATRDLFNNSILPKRGLKLSRYFLIAQIIVPPRMLACVEIIPLCFHRRRAPKLPAGNYPGRLRRRGNLHVSVLIDNFLGARVGGAADFAQIVRSACVHRGAMVFIDRFRCV